MKKKRENELIKDLQKLIRIVKEDRDIEEFIDLIEDIYANVVAMRIASFPVEQRAEILKEDLDLLAASLGEALLLYVKEEEEGGGELEAEGSREAEVGSPVEAKLPPQEADK